MESVLVPVDGSDLSLRALEYALEQYPDATITVLTVVDFTEAAYVAPSGVGMVDEWEAWEDEAQSAAEEHLDRAAEVAADHGADVTTVKQVGPTSRTIVDYVEDEDVDHVVMGSHGRSGVSRILLGSVAESVMRRAPVPVTVVR